MKSILGRKIGMTQIFDADGKVIPVTVVSAGPCTVVQVKTVEKDGYSAIKVGYEEQKPQRIKKPVLGQYTKRNLKPQRLLREIRLSNGETFEVGQTIGPEIFADVSWVEVMGVSKGKGFQGVMKRHNYAGGPASHGSMFHRAPGSIGQSSFPSRVFKNKALPGQMGNKRITVKGLKVFDVRSEENILLVSGSIPGPVGGMVIVRKAG